MHRITSLELLGTLIAGLEQKSKLIDLRPTFAENLLFQWEKWNAFKSKTWIHEEAYFHEIKGYCNAEDRFNVYSFLQFKLC